ncbi:AraC family transcriptional regulator [Polymorphobacter arshaanensis]|uniref:AraC family transcriptional regulator n=1 Tax=Glacieibacterium arshaanense TaxID=2511025 RepID=A0A4Y9EPH2_9SPHN|nr:AraC family transcriptional regulator ligand-binding domain-containing protein [Polymorphobacter arshaanensis]TFU05501.1 AraC family transcriptional regulator [Polymorphobacter arshaanensis]
MNSAIPSSALPQAHAGTLRQFVRYAETTGLDLDACLDAEMAGWVKRAAELDTVPAHVVVDVLEVCAAVGERPDLGIAFAAWSNPRGFGPLSLLWDHCPTFGEVVRVASRYLHLENQALGAAVEREVDEVSLCHFTAVPARFGSRQFIEATLALDVHLARMMFGEHWAPLRLELDFAPPRIERFRRNFFACPIEYGALRNALVIRQEDMDRLQPNANPSMLAYLEAQLERMALSRPSGLVEQVEQAVLANLPGGTASLDHVAQVLTQSRRTLQRRLGEQGRSFADIVLAVRKRVAEDYFSSEPRPQLTELAYRLGFADATVAGRFLAAHLRPARAMRRRLAPGLRSFEAEAH